MRAFAPVILAVVVCGCHSKTPTSMGSRAPLYGSTKDLLSTAGFIEGTWIKSLDESTARNKDVVIVNALNARLPERLRLWRDGRYAFYWIGYTAHGTWNISGTGIDLSVKDVDGIGLEQVRQDYAKYLAQPHGFWRRNNRRSHEWLSRWQVLDMARMTKRLELYSDQKQLFEPNANTREDGTSFLGTTLWTRAE